MPGREIAERLAQSLGTSVVAENKPGAGGMLATQDLLSQPADGYTLQICSVYPSAGCERRSCVASMPPAPGLFSATTDVPRDCASLSAISRPGISAGPPGGNPIRSPIGRAA